MSNNELLDQFTVEARDCLEAIGQRLLEIERSPDDKELVNDLFRQVHTLKGNCGLFEFKALERVVHAGEDVLDQVRNDQLTYTPELADALLNAMDCTSILVDQIACHGALQDDAGDSADIHANALRALLCGAKTKVQAAAAATVGSGQLVAAPLQEPLPGWVKNLQVELHQDGLVAIFYDPEPECFFKGEDPWRLACTIPGLIYLDAQARTPWPDPETLDCYLCNLTLIAVSSAPRAYLEEHFRYVPEQVQWFEMRHPVSSMSVVSANVGHEANIHLLDMRLAQIWDEQRALLSRPGVHANSVAAARVAFVNLLGVVSDQALRVRALEALQDLQDSATQLSAWSHEYHPGSPVANVATAAISAPVGSAPELRATNQGIASHDESAGRTLKVSQEKIDCLMDLIGEMVVAKNALPYLAARAEATFGQRELAREIKAQYSVINRIAEDMQRAIMQVRMLPVGAVFQRFGRLVRDLSKKLGKDVQLILEGEETEADKNVIEGLADPLIHILRNSLDHGLELPEARLASGKRAQGTLKVSAHHEGDRVMLDISDDGAGIDTDRVRSKAIERGLIPAERAGSLTDQEVHQLIFLPGFSTAETISDLSGRGVGMDVVRSAVERINGSITLESVRGHGTHIRLALPLSMAVTNVMMVETGGRRFGVPMDLIVETVRVPAQEVHLFKQTKIATLRGQIVPLRAMNELLAMDTPQLLNDQSEHAVLVVRSGRESVGLIVDDFHGTSDIILKPLEGVLAGLTGFAGTALMGDGSVLMVLNPKELL